MVPQERRHLVGLLSHRARRTVDMEGFLVGAHVGFSWLHKGATICEHVAVSTHQVYEADTSSIETTKQPDKLLFTPSDPRFPNKQRQPTEALYP